MYLFCVFLFSACTPLVDGQSNELFRANSLMQTNPAASLEILRKIPQSQLSKKDMKAWFSLLFTQAIDKNYMLHTSDSLMLIAVNYYDSVGDIPLLAKSHYYLGRVYQDMEKAPEAVQEFLMSMPLAEDVKDYELICLLQGNLGNLLWQHGLFDEADSLYQQVEQFAKEQNDSIRLALVLSKRGNICIGKGEKYYVTAEHYLKQSLVIAKNVGNIYIQREIMNSLGSLYEYMGRYSESIFYIQRVIYLQPDTTKHYSDYLILGSAYYKMEKYDTASVYLAKSLQSDSYRTKEGAYMRLADIARKHGHMNDALQLEDCYMANKDSANQQEVPVEIVSLLKDVLHQQSTQKYKSLYRIYLFILVIVSLLIVSYLFYKHVRGKRIINELLKNRYAIYLQCEILNKALQEKENEIEVLQQHNVEFDTDRQRQVQLNISLNELLDQKRIMHSNMEELLVQRNTEIEQLRKIKFKNLLEASSSYEALLLLKETNCKNPDAMRRMTIAEWRELISEIDRVSFDFTTRLSQVYERILEDDIYFCCLVKLGLKFSDMAWILACTVDAVYKREKSILHRMQVNFSVRLKELLNKI